MTSDSSKLLQKARSGVSTSEMKAIRTQVGVEIHEVKNSSLKPPSAGVSADKPSLPGASTTGDVADLEKAGKIADNFMEGMEGIADVLMLLVMKFGRAAQLVRLLLLGIIVGTLLLTVNLVFSWHLGNVQEEIQEKQAKIQEQQQQILDRQKSTERVAGEAKVIAAAAEKTASEVKDSAPSVVVDAKTGRPQIILKVQDKSGDPAKTGDATKTVDPKRSTLKNDGQNLQTPVTF